MLDVAQESYCLCILIYEMLCWLNEKEVSFRDDFQLFTSSLNNLWRKVTITIYAHSCIITKMHAKSQDHKLEMAKLPGVGFITKSSCPPCAQSLLI